MNTKGRLLSLFERNKGKYLSGEQIAQELAVSRTSVWKAVNSLRKEGYEIDAVPNKGYSLSVKTDIVSEQGIEKYLDAASGKISLQVLSSAGSTNALLREKAEQGAAEGTVIVVNEQTAGRGRFGRQFYSPSDTGVYLSLLLRPRGMHPQDAVGITTMAAVAAAKAIESVSGQTAGIKWVNDIYMRGKKVSGILTEASLSMETGTIDYIVLGIGVNVYEPGGGFPGELKEIAGAVFQIHQNDGKNKLTAAFLDEFMSIYAQGINGSYVQEYKKKSIVLGKTIRVLSQSGFRDALALDMDDQCRLLVQYENGEKSLLSSGEISIRLGEL